MEFSCTGPDGSRSDRVTAHPALSTAPGNRGSRSIQVGDRYPSSDTICFHINLPFTSM